MYCQSKRHFGTDLCNHECIGRSGEVHAWCGPISDERCTLGLLQVQSSIWRASTSAALAGQHKLQKSDAVVTSCSSLPIRVS